MLENEAKVLKDLYVLKDPKHEVFMRWLPKLLETFKLDNGTIRRAVNVIGYIGNTHYSLEEVKLAKPKLEMEHAVWMFNRIMGGLSYVNVDKEYIHGAILPPHIMIDPEEHGGIIIDWSYATKKNSKITAISPKWKAFYPPEIFRKENATPAVDVWMAVKTIIYILGGNIETNKLPDHIPSYLGFFLKGCLHDNPKMRPNNIWQLHEEFKEHMRKNYGPKKFVHFEMPKR